MSVIPRNLGGDPCTPDDSNDCDPARTEACAPDYPEVYRTPTIKG